MSTTSKIERHKTNPFLTNLVITTNTKKERVSIGANVGETWISQNTGEMASTQIFRYRQVDGNTFTKLFAQNIGLTFNLKSAGIKALNVLLYVVQYHAINKDIVQLDDITLEDFLKDNPSLKLSRATLYNGITELIKTQILARHLKSGFYFINPSFCFNGNRMVFINAIERNTTSSSKQEDLFNEQDLLN